MLRHRASTQREAILEQMLEAVPGGVVHLAEDGTIEVVNREALRLFAVSAPDLLGSPVFSMNLDVVDEHGVPMEKSKLLGPRALATGQPQGPETLGYRQPDGSTRWAMVRAVPLQTGEHPGVVVTFVDITERVLAEQELRVAEERWRTLATNLPDPVLIVDAEGRIQFSNLTSDPYPRERVIGAHAWDFVDEDRREDWRTHFREALASGQPQRFDTAGRSETGGRAWYETVLVPLTERGAIRRLVVVARDVTERKMLLARAAEHERLASIGMLAASVAHEIMNPLTYVLANLEYVIGDRHKDAERTAKALVDAREGALRMQQIVRDLRSLGRAGTEELFYVDTRAVLETAVRLTGPELAHAAQLHLEVSDMQPVIASESRLCQVFINLLVNAAQAVRDQPGPREITVRSVDEDAAGFVGVSVADTGPGIPEGQLERVFEPFYTTKPQGTGLGLSITRDIVTRIGGRVDVASAAPPASGATFTVWLPTRRSHPGRSSVGA